MIIKNAAFIFDPLTNKTSRSITLKKLSVPNGQIALAELVLDKSWAVTFQKLIPILISSSFQK